MAKVPKAEAARLIGVARQTIYDYINQGRISTEADGLIDTSELIRAGFTLRLPDSQQNVGNGHNPTVNTTASDAHAALQNQVHTSKVIDLYEQRIARACLQTITTTRLPQ
jgi:copper oxidase (laccase) domain-containing protein